MTAVRPLEARFGAKFVCRLPAGIIPDLTDADLDWFDEVGKWAEYQCARSAWPDALSLLRFRKWDAPASLRPFQAPWLVDVQPWKMGWLKVLRVERVGSDFVLSSSVAGTEEVRLTLEQAQAHAKFAVAVCKATGVMGATADLACLKPCRGEGRWPRLIGIVLQNAVVRVEPEPASPTDRMDVERTTYREPYDREAMLERDNWTCRLCLLPIERGDECLDHVVPIALGGADAPWNVQAAHRACNARKAASPPAGRLVVVPDWEAA